MSLLNTFLMILAMWRPAFCKNAAFTRAKEHAIACLCCCGRKTIASMAIFLSRYRKLPIADYKFYSDSTWKVQDLFDPLLPLAAEHIKGEYICIAADDTKIHKTGKSIPYAGWQLDPLGPKFHTNLIWALRYLQISILLPLYVDSNTPARSIPVRFAAAPSIKKPGKRATEAEWESYKKLSKEYNLSTIFVEEVKQLRKSMDERGLANKTMIMSCDGSFCNKTCMAIDDPRIVMVARCRKNAKLCRPSTGTRKFYDDKKFTPEDVRQDASIEWATKQFFYGGQWRAIRYKEVQNVLWQNGTRRAPLRLIVLAPLPYFRGGKRHYRNPAYLLTTSLDIPIEVLIQAYFDRWQIEYNHRDEKSILGVGQAQVWNETSVIKQPAFHVAVYSALLMANVIVYKDQEHADFGERPKWRKKPKRNTCRALIGLLRSCLLEAPEQLPELGITTSMICAILRMAA